MDRRVVVFEELLGKKIRVVQPDGYIKYGTLEKVDGTFLYLRFDSGKLDVLNAMHITSCAEAGE
jgi:hypothetical protein